MLGGIAEYVFRKSALEAIGGFIDFPMAVGSDNATALLMAKNGIVCSGDFLVRFRYSGKNISSEGNYLEEKAVATIMKFAFIYNRIVPQLSDDTIYKKHWNQFWRNMYPYNVKKEILDQIYNIPFSKRKQFIDLIDKYTPYLDSRNKFTLKFRVFFKIK